MDGEWHALPARLLAEVLTLRGFRVDYLGAQVPTPHLIAQPGLFATAFSVPRQHAYGPQNGNGTPDRSPLGQLRAALDELVDAGMLDGRRREGAEYAVWSLVHGLAVLSGQGPLRDVPAAARHHLEERVFAFIEQGLG